MTLATLLLALLTAANPSSDGGTSDAVLLDFHADWCGPCQRMRPAVNQLSRKGIPVKSINIDRAKAVADRYGVSAVPTFIVVDRSGRELDRTSGLQPAAELERFYLAARAKAQPPSQSRRMPSPATTRGPIPATMKTHRLARCGGCAGNSRATSTAIATMTANPPAIARRRPSSTPIRPRPWCGSR